MIGVRVKRRPFLYPGEEVRPAREPQLKLQGATKFAIETGRIRLVATAGLFGAAFLMIGLRIVDLMVMSDETPAVYARAHTAARSPLARADIVDRNGIIIATNLPTDNLYADTHAVPDAKDAATKLTATFPDLKYDDVVRHMSSGQRFIYLRRNLTPEEKVAANRLGIPGVYFEESESRAYLHSSLFAQVLGNTDPDNHGLSGIEKTFDKKLAASDTPLQLSLDVRVQSAVHESLSAAIARFHAAAGSAVVMDAHSGEILAMVSLPDYDPKAVGKASQDARFNRATLGLFEMGSAFKLFTAAMALETGSANLNSTYDTAEPIKIGRFTIHDDHPLNRRLSVPEILVHSSNIGAAKMALEAGTETQKSYLKKFGLLSQLELEVPERGTPQFPSTWRDVNTITISYGHGISVTPVHMAAGVAALVNGGMLYAPTLIHRTADDVPAGKRVISEKTSDAMRAMMRMIATVEGGTGRQADAAARGYDIGGKTGSAEKVGARGGYSKSTNRTVFVAAFPIAAPRYVVFVMLDEPHGIKETYNFATAGWNAAPTAGTIVNKIGPMLGVYPVGYDDNFAPLNTLMQAYTNSGGDPYSKPMLVKNDAVPPASGAKTPAPVAEAPSVDPFGESDAEAETEENANGIGELIGTLRAEGARNINDGDLPSPHSTGGTGAAQ